MFDFNDTLADAARNAPAERVNPNRSTKKRSFRYGLIAAQIGMLIALLAAWQFSVSEKNLLYFSRPDLVLSRLYELLSGPEIYRHIEVTLSEIAIGYGLGAAAGLVLGLILGRIQFLSDLLQPYIIAMYSIPKVALAPLFIVWLGLGIHSKVAVVAVMTFFLVFFNTYSGLITANEELVRLARLMGASWAQTVRRVILPAAAPQIFIGLKTAVPYAVIGAVIGEYIGANEGLGHFILYASQTYDAPALFAGIVILVSIVFVVNYVLNKLEARAMRWRRTSQTTIQL
ncbi:MAG TPA: ABC transporter permease [Burkholderiales bacterium]|nr:ABC transporter permease [Burkholderiales bacterium]